MQIMDGVNFEASDSDRARDLCYLNSQDEWEYLVMILVLSTTARDIYGITYRIKAHTRTLNNEAGIQLSKTSHGNVCR